MMALLRKRQEALPKKLLDWVTDGLKQGHSSEDIAKQLEETGYTKKQIAEAMGHPEVEKILGEELVAWVVESLKSGQSREEIARQLEETGYTQGKIRKVLSDKRVRGIVSDQLMQWVIDGLKEGYSPGEMRTQLHEAGYTPRQVRQALSQSGVRRASRIWAGKDSVPRHEVPLGLFRGIAITVLVLLIGAFIVNRIPVSTTLWPSTLVSEIGLNEEEAVPLTNEKVLSAVLAFKLGERHTLDVRASGLDISRLDLEIEGKGVASADISSSEPEVYHLKFTPEQAIGLLTLKSDGDIIVYKLTYKRPRKLFGQ